MQKLIKKADDVLLFFLENKDVRGMILEDVLNGVKTMQTFETARIIDFLVNEKYVKAYPPDLMYPMNLLYIITIKGELLILRGGYRKFVRREGAKEFFSNIGSFFLVLGAIAAIYVSALEGIKFSERRQTPIVQIENTASPNKNNQSLPIDTAKPSIKPQ